MYKYKNNESAYFIVIQCLDINHTFKAYLPEGLLPVSFRRLWYKFKYDVWFFIGMLA